MQSMGPQGATADFPWLGQLTRRQIARSGAVLLVLALALLVWNDGRRTSMVSAIDEMVEQMVYAPQTGVDPSLEGKPVAVTGILESKGEVSDPWFRIAARGPVLVREVRMYQWLETDALLPGWLGGGKRVEQGWAPGRLDTSQFSEPTPHINPEPPVPGATHFGMDARFGPYRLDHEALVSRAIADFTASRRGAASLADWVLAVAPLPAPDETLRRQGWVLRGDAVYGRHDADPAAPKLGDVEVRFYTLANGLRGSVIGAQQGERIVPWRAADGSMVLLGGAGAAGIDALIAQARIAAGAGRGWLRWLALGLAVLGGAFWVGHGQLARVLGERLEGVPPLAAGAGLGLLLAGLAMGLAYALGAGWATLLLLLLGVASAIALAYSSMLSAAPQPIPARLRDEPEARARAAAVLAAVAPAAAVSATRAETEGPAREELAPLEWNPEEVAKVRGELQTRSNGGSNEAAEPAAEAADAIEFIPQPLPDRVAQPNAAPAPDAAPPPPQRRRPAPPPPAAPAAPLFETVAPREATAPAPLAPELADPGPAAKPKLLRVALGAKGAFQIHKLVRKHADGREELLAYELTHAGAVVFRGSQEQVKARLKELLAGG